MLSFLRFCFKQPHVVFVARNCYEARKLVLTSEEDGIRKVILNNPKKRNALSLGMLEELSECMFKNLDDVTLRCIVLSSTGPVFSSGHNLRELNDSKDGPRQYIFQKCTELMLGIRKAPVPIIADVRGLAAAAGCQLVASCDIVVASQKATFSTPGASVGLFCSTPGVALSRVVPQKVSSFLLLTGETISADEALKSGLVSKVAPEEEMDSVVYNTAQAILSKSRSVIELGKQFYYEQLQQDIETAYKNGCEVMVQNLAKMDAREGIVAFLEKRKPRWTHT